MPDPGRPMEELLGALIVEGQRCQVWIRSELDDRGIWHNAAVFRRDGKLGSPEAVVAGLDWHLAPPRALERARALGDGERLELYQGALRPRRPLA